MPMDRQLVSMEGRAWRLRLNEMDDEERLRARMLLPQADGAVGFTCKSAETNSLMYWVTLCMVSML